MTKSLVLSLGHNSSAIAIEDGQIICGYEEERFTLKKSDSAYPKNAIEKCIEVAKLPADTSVYIGHWFLDGKLPEQSNKYLDYEHLYRVLPNYAAVGVDVRFTHHDSHLLSGMVFADQEGGLEDSYHAFVLDGFGTHGEAISVYEVTGKNYKLISRWYGFEKSLGMLYQYATAYMGMQMHNHEYKILAYEIHIFDTPELASMEPTIDLLASQWVDEWFRDLNTSLTHDFDPMISVKALPNLQNKIASDLDNMLLQLGFSTIDLNTKRIVVSRFIQKCVEKAIATLFDIFKPENLLVVGGLFYNVKINSILAKKVPGRFCAMPLAGDQGAGLGVYEYYNRDLVWPGHLAWGHRDLTQPQDLAIPEGVIFFKTEAEAYKFIADELEWRGFVNIVRGAMEFGPRALCNTSTIAKPDLEITGKINKMNQRTNEMPMAPVMTQAQANDLFEEVHKVHMSLDYMIVTRDYKQNAAASVLGAAHFYKDENVYTGRPQITSDPMMTKLLSQFGPLVNTSFNFHGVPIVYDIESIFKTHISQKEHSTEPFFTVIIEE